MFAYHAHDGGAETPVDDVLAPLHIRDLTHNTLVLEDIQLPQKRRCVLDLAPVVRAKQATPHEAGT